MFSERTVTRLVEEISVDVTQILCVDINRFTCFSSTPFYNVEKFAPLLSIKGNYCWSANIDTVEKIVPLLPIKAITSGEQILILLKNSTSIY